MFGGIGLYSEDTFFAVIDNDTIFFKVNDQTVARYKAMKMSPFNPMPEKGPMLGYYQVPAAVLEDAGVLMEWAAEAIGVGRAAATAPRPTSRKTSSPKKPGSKKPARAGARAVRRR